MVNKLKQKYGGPFKVVRVKDNGVTYVIEHDTGTNRYTKSVHHKQIKKFNKLPKYLFDHLSISSHGLAVHDDYDSDLDFYLFGGLGVIQLMVMMTQSSSDGASRG